MKSILRFFPSKRQLNLYQSIKGNGLYFARIELQRAGLPYVAFLSYEALCKVGSEVWQHLVDTFRNREIEFGFSLQCIKTALSVLNIQSIL